MKTNHMPNVVKAELPPARVKKFASIVHAGASFEVLDGSRYRVISSLEIGGEAHFKLACVSSEYCPQCHSDAERCKCPNKADLLSGKTLGGKVVSASKADVERMIPLSPQMARIASVLRMIAADSDWDSMVKEAIRSSGFPVDESQNWTRWFRTHYNSKLLTKDPSLIEDAIQELIIKYLYSGNYLKNNMDPSRLNQSKGQAEQVTQYLTTLFTNKRSEAQSYIEKQLGTERKQRNVKTEKGERVQEKNPSGQLLYWTAQSIGRQKTTTPTKWPVWTKEKVEVPTTESGTREGEEGEYNIFDQTESTRATDEFNAIVQDQDLRKFRTDFFKFVTEELEQRDKTASQALLAFDLAIESEEGRQADFVEEWTEKTGLVASSLKVTLKKLGDWLRAYVAEYPGAENAHEFIRLMMQTLKKEEAQIEAKTSSLVLADAEEVVESDHVQVVAVENATNVPPLALPNVVAEEDEIESEYLPEKDDFVEIDEHVGGGLGIVTELAPSGHFAWVKNLDTDETQSYHASDLRKLDDSEVADLLDENNPEGFHEGSEKTAYRDPLLETEDSFVDKKDPLLDPENDLQSMGGYAPTKNRDSRDRSLQDANEEVLGHYGYTLFSGKEGGKQYWKSSIGTVVTLFPDGEWAYSDGTKGASSKDLDTHLLKYHHKMVPKMGASHRFQHDAELCVYQVLNGGFSQLWGNYGKREGYNVPASLVRTAKFFEENNRADVAAIFREAAKINGDDSEVTDENYEEWGEQWDDLENKFYDLWNNDPKLEALFPEEAPAIYPSDADNDKALKEIEKESADKDDDANCPGCGSALNNAEGPYCGGRYCPQQTDPSDMHESASEDSERLHRELKRGPVFATKEPSMKEAARDQAITIRVPNSALLPDNNQWQNRFQIRSESSDRMYTVAQNKSGLWWGCSCMGWIRHKNCKHLRELGLPANKQPQMATLSATTTRFASSKEETMKLPASAKVNAAKDKKASVDKFAKFREIVAAQPQEIQAALEEFRDTFAMMASKTNAMIKNLNLVTATDSTSLKEKVAAKRNFASGLKKLADETPGAFADALGQMYQQLDDVADGIEAVAQNLGVELPMGGAADDMVGDPLAGDMGEAAGIEDAPIADMGMTNVEEAPPVAPAAPLPDAVPAAI